MKIRKFENLSAWKLAQDLAVEVYQSFESSSDIGFKNQITRASVSVSNNIAEGFDRGYPKEFTRYLKISKDSCGEVKSMIYLANRLNKIDISRKDELLSLCNRTSAVIYALHKSIRE